MQETWFLKISEVYKGFEIVQKRHALGGGYTTFFTIYKDGEPYSILSLNSPKACKNCIDTYVRSLKDG